MIPLIGNNLRDILGKLGAWPCDFDQQTAVALYDAAIKHLAPNSVVVDLTPSGGKTMVILSAAAFRVGAKVVSLVDKSRMHPAEEMWFNRAFKMFKLKGTCTAAAEITNMEADMIVVRGADPLGMQAYLEGLKPDGILFGINVRPIAGHDPEQSGNRWAVWRKPKPETVIPSVADKYGLNGEKINITESQSRILNSELEKMYGGTPNGGMTEWANGKTEDAIVISEEEAYKLRQAQEG